MWKQKQSKPEPTEETKPEVEKEDVEPREKEAEKSNDKPTPKNEVAGDSKDEPKPVGQNVPLDINNPAHGNLTDEERDKLDS